MADIYYSGTKEDVEDFLAAVKIGTSRVSGLTPAKFQAVQARIDDMLDDQLSAVLYTPILKVTDKNEHTVYPGTIRNIAIKRVAAEICSKKFGEQEPNVSALAVTWKTEADEEVRKVIARELTVRGQNYRNQNHFAPPNIMPLSPPGAPAVGGV
jgi:hypothetical protein